MLALLLPLIGWTLAASGAPRPDPATTEGYLACLLINEVAFPGERGYRSEADSTAAMDQLLMVLDRRLQQIPPPYSQREIAATAATDLLDIITAGGIKGQFDGFYRDASGKPVMVPRVTKRIDNLFSIASTGEPGRFARLLDHAVTIASRYVREQAEPTDRHAPVRVAEGEPSTGGGYAWMTDEMRFHPGGNFLRIEAGDHGSLGGNRFFTLRKQPR